MARRPAKLGLDEDGNIDDATLRRFVFQTFGRARRTQDSPVMPGTSGCVTLVLPSALLEGAPPAGLASTPPTSRSICC